MNSESLGETIMREVAPNALPSTAQPATGEILVLASTLALALAPDQAKRSEAEILEYVSSKSFADAVDSLVGPPHEGESEDSYVKRANKSIREILMNQLDG